MDHHWFFSIIACVWPQHIRHNFCFFHYVRQGLLLLRHPRLFFPVIFFFFPLFTKLPSSAFYASIITLFCIICIKNLGFSVICFINFLPQKLPGRQIGPCYLQHGFLPSPACLVRNTCLTSRDAFRVREMHDHANIKRTHVTSSSTAQPNTLKCLPQCQDVNTR